MKSVFFSSGRPKRVIGASANTERGLVLAILPFLIVALLSLAALAIDGGNLILTQLRLQKAVDTAARLIPLQFISFSNEKDQIRDFLIASIQANATSSSIPVSSLSKLDVEVTDTQASIRVVAERPWYLAQADKVGIPIPSVAAGTAVTVPRLNIAFVMDLSRSMKEKNMSSIKNKQTMLETLQGTIAVVGEFFRPSYDRLALVGVDNSATVMIPFETNGGFDKDAVTATVSSLQAAGWTNLQDGLRVAREMYAAVPQDPEEMRIALVISDGHSNVSSMRFDPSTVNPDQAQLPKSVNGTYEYYSMVANMSDSRITGYTIRMSPLDPVNPWYAGKPACIKSEPFTDPDPGIVDLTDCFVSNIFRVYTADGSNTFTFPLAASSFREHVYLGGISEGDALRQGQVTVAALIIGGSTEFPPGVFNLLTKSSDNTSQWFRRLTLDSAGLIEDDPDFPQVTTLQTTLLMQGKNRGKTYIMGKRTNPIDGIRLLMGAIRFVMTE